MATEILSLPIITNIFNNTSSNTRECHDLYQIQDHSSLDIDSQSFQFQAAAAKQIIPLLSPAQNPIYNPSSLLITSPYILPSHLLDLHCLPDIQDRILSLALTRLQPTTPNYATAPYESSLNWTDIKHTMSLLCGIAQHEWKAQDYHAVVFRSKLAQNFDAPLLWELDRESHREAVESGGLLKYWFGTADVDRRNLATCIWRNREDARKGGSGPWHRKARAAGAKLYEEIEFEMRRLVVGDGVKSLRFEELVR